MVYSDFKILFDEVIYKYYSELQIVDKMQYSGKVLFFKNYKVPLIYYYYEHYRKNIRKLYMSEQSKPLDRHKIAACMMGAVLKAKVIKVNRFVPKLPPILLLANEYLAFFCAINVLEWYIKDEINAEYKIIYPLTYIKDKGENSYIDNVCTALYYTKPFRVSDVFSYANIFFLLEKNTDTQLGIQR